MKRIPREIDELIWTLAEMPDDAALDDFARRYPEFRPELARRLRALRALRAARPALSATDFVPGGGFGRAGGRRWVPVAAALALGVVALGAAMVAGVKAAHAPSGGGGSGATCETDPSPPPTPPGSASREGGLLPREGSAHVPEPPAPTEPPLRLEETPSALLLPVTVRAERASLKSVVEEIGRQAGLEVGFAPGFVDDAVEARYEGVRAIDALRDLGQNFGFTPLETGPDSVLIVPELDPGQVAPSLGGAGHSAPIR